MSQRISFKVFFMTLIAAAVLMSAVTAQVPLVASVGAGLHPATQAGPSSGLVSLSSPEAAGEMLQFKAGATLLGFRAPRPTWWAWIMR